MSGLNIILDPILIFGFDLNVVGAALGTAISNVAAALFFIIYFMKNSDVVSVNIKLAKPNKEMLSEIFKIGIPAFLMSILMGFTGLVLNLFLAHYGNFAIASYGISFRLVQFPELIIMGLCEGVVPLIAYNFMANKGRMKDVIKAVIMSIGVIFVVCMSAVFTIGHHMVELLLLIKPLLRWRHLFESNNGIIIIKWYRFLVYWYASSDWARSWCYNYGHFTRCNYHSSIIYYECFVWTNRCHLVIINC